MKRIKNFRLFESDYELPDYELPDEVKERLHDDGEGNYLFYHFSTEERDVIKPGTGQNILTSREEGAALSSVNGLAMYYINPSNRETNMGFWRHVVKIPKEKVYYFNTDALNFYDEALERFRKIYDGKERPMLAFNPNYQLAWLTKVAVEKGFQMVIAIWGRRDDGLRAQTTLKLKPFEAKRSIYGD